MLRSMMAVPLLVGLMLGCSSDECRTGTVAVPVFGAETPQAVRSTETAGFPAEAFGFDERQFVEAIVGTWVAEGLDARLVVETLPGADISFATAADDSVCLKYCEVPVVATIVNGEESRTSSGSFASYSSLAASLLELNDGCQTLRFTDTTLTRLEGVCEFGGASASIFVKQP